MRERQKQIIQIVVLVIFLSILISSCGEKQVSELVEYENTPTKEISPTFAPSVTKSPTPTEENRQTVVAKIKETKTAEAIIRNGH